MSKPTDTLSLQKSLEQVAETITNIRRTTASALEQIGVSGVDDIATALANAAVAAGMPAHRAFDYAEEYASLISKAKRELAALLDQVGQPGNAIESLIHIATVVPHRCPSPATVGGRPALVLTR